MRDLPALVVQAAALPPLPSPEAASAREREREAVELQRRVQHLLARPAMVVLDPSAALAAPLMQQRAQQTECVRLKLRLDALAATLPAAAPRV